MRVAIVGCGAIGQKRSRALGNSELVICVDADLVRAAELAKEFPGCSFTADWKAAVSRPDVDIVVVATFHDLLSPISEMAVSLGKHVLVEKPGGRTVQELEPVLAASRRTGAKVHVGFNLRFHRAIQKARAIADSGVLGELMFARGRYGHGGRPGMEKEWRCVPRLSGGGEAIDQGIHLVDLSRWFLGEFTSVRGATAKYYWDSPVEDNAFFLLRTQRGQVAFLHASWTEWKNTFWFEIAGRNGKIEVNGLGGSYGVERVTHYNMLPEMGPPETTSWEYPMGDRSWESQFRVFLEDIAHDRQTCPGIEDAQAALRVIEALYQQEEP